MNKTQKGSLSLMGMLVVVVLLALVLGLGYLLLNNDKGQVENEGEENVACTMDAKQCPDGSYVGRVAPNCEFKECPTAPSEPVKEPVVSMVAGLNEKTFLGGGIYITPLKVLSDNRCPVDVTCIIAGSVVLKVKLEKDFEIKEAEIETEKGVDFGPGLISLDNVAPEQNTKKPFKEEDYEFTFKVDWKLD